LLNEYDKDAITFSISRLSKKHIFLKSRINRTDYHYIFLISTIENSYQKLTNLYNNQIIEDFTIISRYFINRS